MIERRVRILAIVFASVAGLISIWLICNSLVAGFTPWPFKRQFDPAATGEFGDFIGGVVGTIINAAAFYFLYLTLQEQRIATNEQRIATNEQRTATNDQRAAFETERLESKFFDLIKMHRDNVSELKMRSVKIREYDDRYDFETLEEEGKAVIKDIFYQFVDCYHELRLFFTRLDRIYEIPYREALEQNPLIENDKRKLALMAKIDICYSIIYYGVGAEGLITLYKIFEGKYKSKFITDLLRYASLKPANKLEILSKWTKIYKRGSRQKKITIANSIFDWRKEKPELTLESLDEENSVELLVNDYHNKYTKYYGGHQFRLGHYFRHLYQSVKFINNQEGLNYDQKYEYVKVLRAQLSNYEQAVLFLNSLSSLGRAWEVAPEIKPALSDQGRRNFELITKYNLIKNLPGETMYGIPFKIFYPNVQYEGTHSTLDNSFYK